MVNLPRLSIMEILRLGQSCCCRFLVLFRVFCGDICSWSFSSTRSGTDSSVTASIVDAAARELDPGVDIERSAAWAALLAQLDAAGLSAFLVLALATYVLCLISEECL